MEVSLRYALVVSLAAHALAGMLLPGPSWPTSSRPFTVELRASAAAVLPPTAVTKAIPKSEPPPPQPARVPRHAAQRAPKRSPPRSQLVAHHSDVPTPAAPLDANVAEPSTPATTADESASPPLASTAPGEALTAPRFDAAYLANPPPSYPAAARRRHIEGTVMLDVLVGADGLPREVRVGKGSGSEELDAAALAAVRGWRFVPARRGTVAVHAEVRVPVRFRLDP